MPLNGDLLAPAFVLLPSLEHWIGLSTTKMASHGVNTFFNRVAER